MSLTVSWEQIAMRLLLACVVSFVIGLDREEQGHPAGVRTTMLVCLAATLAMLQVNLLLPVAGKTSSSFAVMDLMRLPLGILSGIGFILAGVIIKRGHQLITGLTTAAAMWFVTVLGLLFGGGQLVLGTTGFLIAVLVLWAMRFLERYIPRQHEAVLRLSLGAGAPPESELHRLLEQHGEIKRWKIAFEPADTLCSIECELKWKSRRAQTPDTPDVVQSLRRMNGIRSLSWDV